MKKTTMIEKIENNGKYYNVKIDPKGWVTGGKVGESSHYHVKTNTGGRVCIGTYQEYLADFSRSGE